MRRIKRIFLLLVSIFLLVGCSDAAKHQDILSNTIWVYEEYKQHGITFTGDGNYEMWEIIDYGDGTGELISGSLHEYTLHKNTITFSEFNLSVNGGERIIRDPNFTVQIKNNSMILCCEYDDTSAKFKKLDTSIQEYAKTIGISVPIQGEPNYIRV